MANESLIVGNSNWAVKANNLLGYAVGETSGYYVPRELDFTRNSTATYTDENGIIQTAAANIARVQDNALLLEPQRTNLALYSEEFDNAAWTKLNSSITANTTTAPDGTNTADILTDDSVNNVHRLNTATNINVVSGSVYTYSVFLKNNNIDYAILKVFSGSNFAILVNLLSQTVSSTSGSVTSKIEIFGDWIRCSMTFTAASTTATLQIATSDGTMELSGNCTYIGSGESVYIWGAQLEQGAYATSYIPTTSATVTRLADACSKTGISSLIGQTQGTLFAEINLTKVSGGRFLSINNGLTSERILLAMNSNNTLSFIVVNSGSTQASLTTTVLSLGTHKVAAAYNLDDFVLYVDGIQIQSDNSGTVPACSDINIGHELNANQFGDGVSQAILFTTRLSNAELASMTTL